MAQSSGSQGGEFTSAFGAVAEVHRRRASAAFDANDHQRHRAVHCGNGFDARFEPLSKYSFEALGYRLLSLGEDMQRRQFITLLGGATTWPLAARAQQPARMRRIGVLMNLASDDTEGQARLAAFHQELQRLGWTVGTNVQIDYRWGAGDAGAFPRYSEELLALAPDVILASKRRLANSGN